MLEKWAKFDILKVAKQSGGFSFFRIPAPQQNTPVSRTAVPEKGTPTLCLAASAGSPEYGTAVVLSGHSALGEPAYLSDGGRACQI